MATLLATAGCVLPKETNSAPSLLPEGKKFKLVWHDEFDYVRVYDIEDAK